jgi:predicted DNA-binding transcriptional regulator AlpA
LRQPAQTAGRNRRKDSPVAVEYLSPAQLAERYGLPLETVYNWNKLRSGPRFMKLGRHVRYRMTDVLAWEASRTRETFPGGLRTG